MAKFCTGAIFDQFWFENLKILNAQDFECLFWFVTKKYRTRIYKILICNKIGFDLILWLIVLWHYKDQEIWCTTIFEPQQFDFLIENIFWSIWIIIFRILFGFRFFFCVQINASPSIWSFNFLRFIIPFFNFVDTNQTYKYKTFIPIDVQILFGFLASQLFLYLYD